MLRKRRVVGATGLEPVTSCAFDIRSPNGVAGHLHALQAKGYIRRSAERGSRQVDVVGEMPPVAIAADGDPENGLAAGGDPAGGLDSFACQARTHAPRRRFWTGNVWPLRR
jgi:SOS-response transcriptional repressor LexA